MRRLFPFALVLFSAIALAQTPSQAKPDAIKSSTGKPYGTIFLKSNIGSFRFMGTQPYDAKERQRAEGRLEITFKGTVLINDLKGKVTATGNLRKEYESKNRVAYFGTGKLIVDGEFWAMQFFGTNLDGRWTGWGLGRLFGEFDQDLNTGFYWFDNAPKKQYWSPFGTTITLPNRLTSSEDTTPKERKPGGGN